jgi:type IV secretory pathway VirJ component
VLQGDVDRTCSLEQAKAFAAYGFSKSGPWRAQWLAAYREIATPAPAPSPQVAEPQPQLPPEVPEVADLPLIETRAANATERPALALLISGDGGWAGIDQSLAAALNAEGIPVVGLDSLRYFWTRRTPQETTDAVVRALRHYLAKWKKTDIVLIGYSRGADLLPFIAHLLPEDLKARTRLLALVAAGKEAEFEVHVTDFFGGSGGKTLPMLPELEAIKGQAVLCVYGDDEKDDSICPSIRAFPGVRALELKGGHHFGGNYGAVAKAILEALPKESPRSPPRSR